MWQSTSFATVELALAFVNEHRLRADQFKVVAAQTAGGEPAIWVLYLPDEAVLTEVAAVAEAEPLPSSATDEVVDAAEAIIADAQREE